MLEVDTVCLCIGMDGWKPEHEVAGTCEVIQKPTTWHDMVWDLQDMWEQLLFIFVLFWLGGG